jgi:hypothetical protein
VLFEALRGMASVSSGRWPKVRELPATSPQPHKAVQRNIWCVLLLAAYMPKRSHYAPLCDRLGIPALRQSYIHPWWPLVCPQILSRHNPSTVLHRSSHALCRATLTSLTRKLDNVVDTSTPSTQLGICTVSPARLVGQLKESAD